MANVAITGAARGIGLELARQYIKNGDRVWAYCRDAAKADQLNALAKASGGLLIVHTMDVSDPKSIVAAARDLGNEPVDILINNAGILGGKNQGLDDMVFEDWIDAFNVMTIAPFRVVKTFLKNLQKASAPKIMTVTSQLGASTWPYGGMYAYASAKAAVNKVMQILGLDLKDKNIIVGLVHPGWVKTDMGGPQADMTPEESAAGISKVIAAMTMADTGKFYKWNGEIHPW